MGNESRHYSISLVGGSMEFIGAIMVGIFSSMLGLSLIVVSLFFIFV